jgi:hypothetical protein
VARKVHHKATKNTKKIRRAWFDKLTMRIFLILSLSKDALRSFVVKSLPLRPPRNLCGLCVKPFYDAANFLFRKALNAGL